MPDAVLSYKLGGGIVLELPEALTDAGQINETVCGKRIINVTAAQSPHKFAFFYKDPQKYHEILSGNAIEKAIGYGGLIEIRAGCAMMLFGDGASLRYHGIAEVRPQKHQLMIEFEDESALSVSVQMYGGLWCFREGEFENPYYTAAKEKPSPLSKKFDHAYWDVMLTAPGTGKMSAKAFLATEQRVPGLGNGVLQDILFNAKIHPKKKIGILSKDETDCLFNSLKSTLAEMTFKGGRDTERDLFGCSGGYAVKLGRNTAGRPCTVCGETIIKENYMGGSIYYCSGCQR
jgi:formamidopyrimidine-DNA glycosylase